MQHVWPEGQMRNPLSLIYSQQAQRTFFPKSFQQQNLSSIKNSGVIFLAKQNFHFGFQWWISSKAWAPSSASSPSPRSSRRTISTSWVERLTFHQLVGSVSARCIIPTAYQTHVRTFSLSLVLSLILSLILYFSCEYFSFSQVNSHEQTHRQTDRHAFAFA